MLRRINGKWLKLIRDLAVGDVLDLGRFGLQVVEKTSPRGPSVELTINGESMQRPADSIAHVVPAQDLIEALLVLDAVQKAVDSDRPEALTVALQEVGKVVREYRNSGVL